jgi:cold shock CspA family protein
MSDERLLGTIKHWNERGFGFIIPDGGRADVFVHMHCIRNASVDQLPPGTRVESQMSTDFKTNRPKAILVDVLGDLPADTDHRALADAAFMQADR